MENIRVEGKNVQDAVMNAALQTGIPSSELEYKVIDEGNKGFLGLFNVKPAVIEVIQKESLLDITNDYLNELFEAMGVETQCDIQFDEENNKMDINLSGDNMGILIGKRGQTLDSLQYLISLFVNKNSENYIKVQLDTENYRERRKKTLENLARNIAYKVKRTRRSISLEPMNPYERRIIHSALQNDRYVCTKSEGEDPYRKVVIMLKR
ncbi:MAG TPA: protein jag [Candidatus Fimousia stercorigallinarum]|nr:protein jag [Candidatus Fimousia stercorigallinarum]